MEMPGVFYSEKNYLMNAKETAIAMKHPAILKILISAN